MSLDELRALVQTGSLREDVFRELVRINSAASDMNSNSNSNNNNNNNSNVANNLTPSRSSPALIAKIAKPLSRVTTPETLMIVVADGWLFVRKRGTDSWKRRYVALSYTAMEWYNTNDVKSRKVKGNAQLSGDMQVQRLEDDVLAFGLFRNGENVLDVEFSADSEAEVRRWLSEIGRILTLLQKVEGKDYPVLLNRPIRSESQVNRDYIAREQNARKAAAAMAGTHTIVREQSSMREMSTEEVVVVIESSPSPKRPEEENEEKIEANEEFVERESQQQQEEESISSSKHEIPVDNVDTDTTDTVEKEPNSPSTNVVGHEDKKNDELENEYVQPTTCLPAESENSVYEQAQQQHIDDEARALKREAEIEIESKEEEITQKKRELDVLKDRFVHLHTQEESLSAQLASIRAVESTAFEDLNRARREIKQSSDRIMLLETQEKDAIKAVEEFKAKNPSCASPTSGRPQTHSSALQRLLMKDGVKVEIDPIAQRFNELTLKVQTTKKSLHSELDRLVKLENERSKAESALKSARAKVADVIRRQQDIVKSKRNLQAKIKEEEQTVDKLSARVRSLREALDALN